MYFFYGCLFLDLNYLLNLLFYKHEKSEKHNKWRFEYFFMKV